MRPTVGDIINGTKQIIQEIVFPFVASHPDHPEQPAILENLLGLMVLLEHAAQRWDRFHLFLEQEEKEVRSLLEHVVTPDAPDRPRSQPAPSSDLKTRWEANGALKTELVRALNSLSPKDHAALIAKVRTLLDQRIAAEKEWVKVGEVTWD